DMDLSERVYTAKTKGDLYLPMELVMERTQFMRLKRNLIQVEGIKDKKTIQKLKQEMNHWSFLHLLSYLVYRPKIETLHLKLMEPLHKYLPEETMVGWEEILHEKIERQLEERKAQTSSEQVTEEEMNEEDALIQKATNAD